MRFSKFLVVMSAFSMAVAPALAASANPAASLSVASKPVRAASKAGPSKASGSSIIIAVLAAAAVIAGIVIAADSSKSP